MARACTVCTHADRAAIDAAIAGETASNRRIATRYGLSESAVRRHGREHLPARMVQAAAEVDVRNAIDIHKQMRDVNAAVQDVLKQARRDGDGELVLKASDRILKQLELQARLIGELEDGTTINVTVTSQWLELRTVIVAALRSHPEALDDVTNALKRLEGGST